MNILKVESSPYYHFRSTPYRTKVTNAVKLFDLHLRRRKPYRFQIWLDDSRYTCSNDAIICDCVNCQFCASFVSYPYIYIASEWSLVTNSVIVDEFLEKICIYICSFKANCRVNIRRYTLLSVWRGRALSGTVSVSAISRVSTFTWSSMTVLC